MSKPVAAGCVLVLMGALVISQGCQRSPSRVYMPEVNASAAGAKAIEMFDTDKDGKLSGPELERCPGLKAALPRVDRSGQGAVTADMIAARIKAWQNSKRGRSQLACQVLRNGQPLAGAEVKFVPEKFLGANFQTASGTTDQNGIAMLNIQPSGKPDEPQGGITVGFYRVEITKPGLNVPAKYNTDTVLGLEDALDVPEQMEGSVKFELNF
jgi:hypothetical protein